MFEAAWSPRRPTNNCYDILTLNLSILTTHRPDGRLTGEAFVIFNSPEESHAAMIDLNRHMLRNRYIELFASNKEEYDLCK